MNILTHEIKPLGDYHIGPYGHCIVSNYVESLVSVRKIRPKESFNDKVKSTLSGCCRNFVFFFDSFKFFIWVFLNENEQHFGSFVLVVSTLLQITPIPAQLYMRLQKDGKKRM